jgi:5-methylcytosine-specific restriction endonuclease McrA
VEKFNDTEIFERDGWLCQLCGLPINREARKPHPMSVSLDHIVPISLGGAHSRANTQCAHYGCNVRKNNRYEGFQQLSLIA